MSVNSIWFVLRNQRFFFIILLLLYKRYYFMVFCKVSVLSIHCHMFLYIKLYCLGISINRNGRFSSSIDTLKCRLMTFLLLFSIQCSVVMPSLQCKIENGIQEFCRRKQSNWRNIRKQKWCDFQILFNIWKLLKVKINVRLLASYNNISNKYNNKTMGSLLYQSNTRYWPHKNIWNIGLVCVKITGKIKYLFKGALSANRKFLLLIKSIR